MRRTLLILTLMAVSLAGCKQFDEGPIMSLYSVEKRVAGRWYFDRVLYGNVDSTANYVYGQLEFIYDTKKKYGAFSWSHNIMQPAGPENFEGGIWRFLSDRDSIEFAFIDLATADTLKLWKWKINRCAYTEFWIERTLKDGTVLTWELWKWAM
jgi:hypothetical protein